MMSLASYAVVYHTTDNKTEPVTVPYTAYDNGPPEKSPPDGGGGLLSTRVLE